MVRSKLTSENSLILAVTVVIVAVLAVGVLNFRQEQPQLEPVNACWVEDKQDGTAERICGHHSQAPFTAYDFTPGPVPPMEDQPGWNCKADGNHLCEPQAPSND